MPRLKTRLLRAALTGVMALAVGVFLCMCAMIWEIVFFDEAAPRCAVGCHTPTMTVGMPMATRPAASFAAEAVPQDTCLTCHAQGATHLIWMPLGRWLAFGAAGAVLAVGLWRAASLYRRRARWTTLRERAIRYVDVRFGVVEPVQKALGKPVPRWSTHWFYCLGGLTLTAFIIQAVTGIMLAFYYKPSAEINPVTGYSYAYESILYIMEEVQFGALVRTIHHWAANLMIVLCVAHMVRVFIMDAYRPPRELNWVVGVLLLVLTLAFGFTGYLLPWDQTAFWAATVGTDIAGNIPAVGEPALIFLRDGWTVTGLTLSRFYGLHVIVLPIATLGFMGLHFLMVRRLGVARPL